MATRWARKGRVPRPEEEREGKEEVGPVGKDGEKQALGDPMGQEGAGPSSWGGEVFHKGEGSVGQGQAVVEMVGQATASSLAILPRPTGERPGRRR